jgi:hypothetical protein
MGGLRAGCGRTACRTYAKPVGVGAMIYPALGQAATEEPEQLRGILEEDGWVESVRPHPFRRTVPSIADYQSRISCAFPSKLPISKCNGSNILS